MTTPSNDAPTLRPAAYLRSAGWVVRRALIGVFALSVFVLGSAALLHASIEPGDTTTTEDSQSE